jgi:hypothetical protein
LVENNDSARDCKSRNIGLQSGTTSAMILLITGGGIAFTMGWVERLPDGFQLPRSSPVSMEIGN